MDPVRGWKIVKGEEDLIVFGETLTGFFVAILIQAQESFIDLMGGLSCRRLIHLVDQSLGIGLYRFRQLIQHVGRLMHPAALMSGCTGNASSNAFQKPIAPSPMARAGGWVNPRALSPCKRVAQDNVLSRCPSSIARTSFLPSAVAPISTRTQGRSLDRRTLK